MKIILGFFSLFILTVLAKRDIETEFGQLKLDPFGYNIQDPDYEPLDDATSETELQKQEKETKHAETREH